MFIACLYRVFAPTCVRFGRFRQSLDAVGGKNMVASAVVASQKVATGLYFKYWADNKQSRVLCAASCDTIAFQKRALRRGIDLYEEKLNGAEEPSQPQQMALHDAR